jgi:hypothetical protein
MAKRGPTTFAKRKRELEKQEKRQAKLDRRAQRKEEKAGRPDRAGHEEDPDIAGIVPGPQPTLEEQGFYAEPAEKEEEEQPEAPTEA